MLSRGEFVPLVAQLALQRTPETLLRAVQMPLGVSISMAAACWR